MISYNAIDKELYAWAASKDYTVQTDYRGDEVRGFEFYSSDHQKKVSLGVTFADDRYVELSIYGGKRLREKYRGSVSEVFSLLDKAESQAKEWMEEKS